MPQTGIEPVREYKSRRILSPVRLPVPPLRHFRNATAFQTTQKRLELSTSAVTGRRSNQLSHWAIFYISWIPLTNGPSGTRTDNLLITNQLLCQLSHIGILYLSLTLNDSYGNRTRVTAVKGRCLNRLTKEPNNINNFYC